MSTAAALGNLLGTNADINWYTQQQMFWNAKYEANSEKLSKQVKYEENWEKAFDSAIDNDKTLKACGMVVHENNQSEAIAEQYADLKVKQYDEELSLELAELDIEYDTMKTMYDSLLEEMRAQQESEKTLVSTNAQDTHLLNQ